MRPAERKQWRASQATDISYAGGQGREKTRTGEPFHGAHSLQVPGVASLPKCVCCVQILKVESKTGTHPVAKTRLPPPSLSLSPLLYFSRSAVPLSILRASFLDLPPIQARPNPLDS